MVALTEDCAAGLLSTVSIDFSFSERVVVLSNLLGVGLGPGVVVEASG
ncbi:MAG: hypothetical protein RML72_12560 [Bacteroidia bacterium]|nr:hypothetical protein [Bacteroidia bacterium]MDW8159691.1 hypothetical protein [Bacteroidia bacterium]